MAEELIRADQLELPFLVLHPGAHLGAGEEAGLTRIVQSIDVVFAAIPKVKTKIALETTAGQGSCLGDRFEHLAYIIANVREPERLCVCLDTAHVFAAGYDIGSEAGVKKTFRQFDSIVGRDRLAAIHLERFQNGAAVRAWTGTNTSGKGASVSKHSALSCAIDDSRKFRKCWKHPRRKDLKEDVANLKTLRALIANKTRR